MKNLILIAVLFFGVLNIQSQEKIYTLTEVDVAPEILKYPIIDSLTSKQNFKKNLKRFIAMNLNLMEYFETNKEKTRVFVEFVVQRNGKIKVLRTKGKSKKAKSLAANVIKKIKKMKPAKVMDNNVDMKFIIPITFGGVILIDTTQKNR
ncbi:hypothetical protein [Polaribacter uvawellassae]|uniref:hypothetical protein n=1 Tax=Polaribacter uvawellassae TaxID=3133495 RepID=UPI00321B0D23